MGHIDKGGVTFVLEVLVDLFDVEEIVKREVD